MSNAKTLHLQFADGEIEVGTLIDALYEQERTIAILRQQLADVFKGNTKLHVLWTEAVQQRDALAAQLEQAREEIEGMHKSLDKLRGQCAGFSAYAEIDRLTAELAAIKGQEVASGMYWPSLSTWTSSRTTPTPSTAGCWSSCSTSPWPRVWPTATAQI